MPEKRTKKLTAKQKQRLIMLVSVLAGAVLGVLAVAFDAGDLLLWYFAFFYIAFFLHIVLHEGGHLIGGLLSGYRFESFRIGGLIWVKQAGKIRLRWMNIAGTGGQCLLAPPDCAPEDAPFAFYHAAGSAMNILAALLHVPLIFVPGLARIYGLCMALVGLYLGCINGIPLRVGLIDNDGMNIRNMKKDRAVRVFFYRQLQINAAMSAGARLRDMPEEWFEAGEYKHLHGVMRFARLMDMQQYEEALAYGAALMHNRKMNGLQRGAVMNDVESLRILLGKPLPAQSDSLKQYRKSMRSDPSVIRAQFIRALLKDQDEAAAEKILRRFEAAARRYPHESGIASDRELIAAARAQYETRKQNQMMEE